MIITKGTYSYAKIREALEEPKNHFYKNTDYYLDYFDRVIPNIIISRDKRKITLTQDYDTEKYVKRAKGYRIEYCMYYLRMIEELNKRKNGFALNNYILKNQVKIYKEIGQGPDKAFKYATKLLDYFYEEEEVVYVHEISQEPVPVEQKEFFLKTFEEYKQTLIDLVNKISLSELSPEDPTASMFSLDTVYRAAREKYRERWGVSAPVAYKKYKLVKPITNESVLEMIGGCL